MHEFLVTLRSRVAEKQKAISVEPAGMVINAMSFGRKRKKWCEIIADLIDPRPRKIAGRELPSKRSQNEAGLILRLGEEAYKVLCERWTPALWERWFENDRLPDDQMGEKGISLSLFWDEEVEKVSGFRSAVGRDPTGTADLIDCFPWSPHARRTWLVIVNQDFSTPEAEAQEGTVETEIIDGRRIIRPVSFVPWESGLGLNQAQRDRIKSPNYIHNPRFDQAHPKSIFQSGALAPDLEALRSRSRDLRRQP